MKRFKIVTLAAVAVLGLGALGGVAVRAGATTSPAPDATTNPAPDAATTLSAPAEAPEADVNTPDADNVQEGDQSTPDTAAEAAGEQAGSEVPGNDGPGGHADEPADPNADHQFEGVE